MGESKHKRFRLPRFRAAVKWSGVTLCGALCIVLAVSGFHSLCVVWGIGNSNRCTVHVIGGGVVLGRLLDDVHCIIVCADENDTELWSAIETTLLYDTSHWRITSTHIGGWYDANWWFASSGGVSWSDWWVSMPLYLPFLLIALPTGFLFYRDRKARPGLCAICRYDLRGLPETTMRCPECGLVEETRKS